jgi:hypothetical protein
MNAKTPLLRQPIGIRAVQDHVRLRLPPLHVAAPRWPMGNRTNPASQGKLATMRKI